VRVGAVGSVVRVYRLSRSPAPQLSLGSPGQAKEQSAKGASTLPSLMLFPQ
jgi:hypothetical protein